jgi:hypothetical protein
LYKESLLYTAEKKGEKKAKMEIAKTLLQAKVNIDIIVISTGLTIEEIKVNKGYL